MTTVLYLSVVTAALSFTVTETKLFEPWRQWLDGKSRFWGGLFACGYCLGHWISLALVAIYRPRLFEGWWPLDYLLTGVAIAWLAAFQWALLCWWMDKAGK